VYTASTTGRAPLATRGFGFNPELKAFDTLGTFSVDANGHFTNLCFPQSGGDINQRIGRKLTIKSVYVRFRYVIREAEDFPDETTAIPNQMGRMVLFMDYQPNGTAPTVLDVLSINSPVSQINLGNRERFKILSDKCYVLDPYLYSNSPQVENRTIVCGKKYKKLNEEMIFSGATGAISDVKTGVLYMFWIGSQPTILGSQVTYTSRVRYSDV